DREGSVFHPDAFGTLSEIDQPVLITVDQRPQQDASNHAENRRVGTNPQGQRDNNGDSQTLDFDQGSQRKAKVGDQAHLRSPVFGCSILSRTSDCVIDKVSKKVPGTEPVM